MKLLHAIKLLKTGATLRDFNIDHRLNALRTVRGVRHVYKVDSGKTYIEYTYTKPMITKVEMLPDDITERIPVSVVADVVLSATPEVKLSLTSESIGVPCDLWLPERKRFTQGCSYRKIADIYGNDGARYHVLTHSVLGGKLYRKPNEVRLQDSGKAESEAA